MEAGYGSRMSTTPAAMDGSATRERLIGGLALALEERRLVDVTMNDIVRHARVSKRTFYEHFADKEACFIALYREGCDLLAEAQARSLRPDQPIGELVTTLTHVYLTTMAAVPARSRASLSDIFGGGDACLAARREQHERFAEGMRSLFASAAELQPDAGIRPMSLEMAAAVVGGINELVLRAFDAGRGDRLQALAPTVDGLIRSVVLDGR